MDMRKLESGLTVPAEKPPTEEDIRKEYYRLHECCPECGSIDTCTTCMGVLITDLEASRDTNIATCGCGWSGIAHDLVPAGQHSQ